MALSLRSSGTYVKVSSSQLEMGIRAWARSLARDSGATCRIGRSEGLGDTEFDKSQHCLKEKEKREVGEVPVLRACRVYPQENPAQAVTSCKDGLMRNRGMNSCCGEGHRESPEPMVQL